EDRCDLEEHAREEHGGAERDEERVAGRDLDEGLVEEDRGGGVSCDPAEQVARVQSFALALDALEGGLRRALHLVDQRGDARRRQAGERRVGPGEECADERGRQPPQQRWQWDHVWTQPRAPNGPSVADRGREVQPKAWRVAVQGARLLMFAAPP